MQRNRRGADVACIRRENGSAKMQYRYAEGMEGDQVLNRFEYIVEAIDGDYAYLRMVDEPVSESAGDKELKLVARALLPPEITEGTKLLYEWMQYSVIE